MDRRDYQQAAAGFFSGLGMQAQVDTRLEGARSVHAVDVLVRFTAYGVDHTWIVECKLWRSAVPKEKVLALKAIVDDAGADRGFLLSESGFQSGATTAARLSNITLTNLEDLYANAQADLRAVRWDHLYSRLAKCQAVIPDLMVVTGRGQGFAVSVLKPGMTSDDFHFQIADVRLLEQGLEQARLHKFPVAYRFDRARDRVVIADDMEGFLDGASHRLDELETWLAAEVAKPWRNKPQPAAAVNGQPGLMLVTDEQEARKLGRRRGRPDGEQQA